MQHFPSEWDIIAKVPKSNWLELRGPLSVVQALMSLENHNVNDISGSVAFGTL